MQGILAEQQESTQLKLPVGLFRTYRWPEGMHEKNVEMFVKIPRWYNHAPVRLISKSPGDNVEEMELFILLMEM